MQFGSMRHLLLEIAVSTPDEAILAVEAGADRLELSSGLELGGLTPSLGSFRTVREGVSAPVYVLLRPSPGGFQYTEREFASMLTDAAHFLSEGATGIVFGILNADGSIHREWCRELVELAKGRAVFHRAFDFLPDSLQALDELIDLGFERVLTSGGVNTSQADATTLAVLVKHAAKRIEILPAGGIRPNNVAELVRASGCDQVHSSAREVIRETIFRTNTELAAAMGTPSAMNASLVRELREQLDRLADSLS